MILIFNININYYFLDMLVSYLHFYILNCNIVNLYILINQY
uniref:Uncharacterized protein n=1 Tax=Osmundaria fimbriata TaxID=228265 RepID=A0A1Z1M412_OSMFI|nr:hypothetical protein [Osmundaria fimbriata]ARW60766.1 hypothetical protein [Osmundaria fimbriata]